jgi:site-specific recombinase XerD
MAPAALRVAEATVSSKKADPPGPLGFSELLGYYRYWMLMRKYPDHTIWEYGQRISRFIEWCAERNITRPGQVTTPTMKHYASSLYRRSDDLLTVCSHLVPIADFYNWLSCHNLSGFNPVLESEAI